MNEEWFGICAKGDADKNGLYNLYPRVAYYALKRLNKEYNSNILKSISYKQANLIRE